MRAIQSDPTGKILDFLLAQDGPAYTCRRYWDWFEPFITQLITDSYAGSNVSVIMMEVCFRILGSVEKIKTEFKDKIDFNYNRDPYLVWSITEATDKETTMV